MAALLLFLCQSFSCRLAQANGRFPRASQLVVDHADPTHLLVSATYGLLVSEDAGAHWSLICESGYGSVGTEDAAVAIMNTTLIVGVHAGLSIATDGNGCAFSWAKSPLSRSTTVDVAIDASSPAHAVALASTSNTDDGGFSFDSALTQSLDDGTSWQAIGTALPTELEALTLDPAPTTPERVYVSGVSVAVSDNGLIERSDDRGGSWTRLPISEAPEGSLPFIAAIDPHDADVVYVRVTRGKEALLVSRDGAHTWQTIYTTTSPIVGFALSPDGSEIALGTADGIYVAHTTDYEFERVNTLSPTCLTWAEAGLYACAQESTQGFSIGLSEDEGAHFRALYHLALECGPNCPAGSASAQACTNAPCSTEAAAGSAGASGAQNGDAAAGTAGVATPADAGPSKQNEKHVSSCGCRVAGGIPDRSRAWFLLLGLAWAGRLRRRARH